ncbi:MAG TPA: DUF1761 domain-containing protein [Terracidiphilus sp.]|nr:DUF1761 domain-containing protein [Terracidiphilus sp.]
MIHLHHLINYWAVLVSAVILWLLGALWYSPVLFGKHWAAIIGRPMGEKPKGVVRGMIASFVGDLFLAFVFAHIILWSHARPTFDGIHIGILLWVGFVAAPLYPQSIYEGRPVKYFLINSVYWLAGFLIMGALFTNWH